MTHSTHDIIYGFSNFWKKFLWVTPTHFFPRLDFQSHKTISCLGPNDWTCCLSNQFDGPFNCLCVTKKIRDNQGSFGKIHELVVGKRQCHWWFGKDGGIPVNKVWISWHFKICLWHNEFLYDGIFNGMAFRWLKFEWCWNAIIIILRHHHLLPLLALPFCPPLPQPVVQSLFEAQ